MATPSTSFITYNVNGIRSGMRKGLMLWLKAVDADVVCLQEIKAQTDQFELEAFDQLGYHHYWYPAQRKGYSGVAILTKQRPTAIGYGIGIDEFDVEGRVIRADFPGYSVVSVYVPSGAGDEARQAYKMRFLHAFGWYLNRLQDPDRPLIVSGDFNICHQSIDLFNPVGSGHVSGFLPVERAWLSSLLQHQLVDAFRVLNQEPHQYTWWSYQPGIRAKNLGWRIDYHLVSHQLRKWVERAAILSHAVHSDHAPILLTLKNVR